MPSIDTHSLHPQLDPDYLNSVLFIGDSGFLYKKNTKALAPHKSVHKGKEGVVVLFKAGDAYFPHHVLCWIMVNGKVPDGYRVRSFDDRFFTMDNFYLEKNEKALDGVIEGDCTYCNIQKIGKRFVLFKPATKERIKSFVSLYEARKFQQIGRAHV